MTTAKKTAAAKPRTKKPSRRRRATVLIWRGEDLDQLSQLRREVEDAKPLTDSAPRLASDPDRTVAALEAYNAFYEVAKERATKVVLEALPRLDWRTLCDTHPAREVTETEVIKAEEDGGEDETVETTSIDPRDAAHGLNDETMPQALLGFSRKKTPRESDPDEYPEVRTVVEPRDETETDEDLEAFLEDLSDADYYKFYAVALMLNMVSADPKALPVFSGTPRNDET